MFRKLIASSYYPHDKTYYFIMDGQVQTYHDLPMVFKFPIYSGWHRMKTINDGFISGDNSFGIDPCYLIAIPDRDPTSDDMWKEFIASSCKIIHQIDKPSQEVLSFHKLLWEV